jgi:hypothetical protein
VPAEMEWNGLAVSYAVATGGSIEASIAPATELNRDPAHRRRTAADEQS